jgi:hypothetical protein
MRVTIKGAPEYVRLREDAGANYTKAPLTAPEARHSFVSLTA